MTPIKPYAIVLSALLIAACNEEQPRKSATTPVNMDAENTQELALKIPGVDDKPDVPRLKIDTRGVTGGSIERLEIPINTGGTLSAVETPRPLLLNDVVRNRFSNLLQGPAGTEILDAIFYPLGWSTDGKFAYAIESPDQAAGSYFLNVYIQDLVTDKIIWIDKYQSEPGAAKGIQSFAEYWQAKQSTVAAQLKKQGVKRVSESVLFAGSISNNDDNDDRLDYVVKKKLKGQPDFGNLAMVTEYQVDVTSDNLGRKTVHKEQYKKTISVLDVDVIGYLRGQDKKRVALLITGVRRGWEGPPHTTWFQVVGVNLRSGFKKTAN